MLDLKQQLCLVGVLNESGLGSSLAVDSARAELYLAWTQLVGHFNAAQASGGGMQEFQQK